MKLVGELAARNRNLNKEKIEFINEIILKKHIIYILQS
jgi:hypothetical protein